MLLEYYESKQIKIPEPTPQQSTAANTLNNKTNWEAEVKARYNLPLAAETGEFPDMDQIRMRMLPICYEEGVIGGIGDNAAQFINTASEIFVKEIMSTVISRVRCNRPATVKTDGFKRKLENMSPDDAGITSQPNNTDTALSRKRLKLPNGNRKNIRPTATLRLPSKDLVGERKVLGMDDLRLSFALGDNFLTQLPLSLYKIMGGGVNMPEDYAAPSAPLKFNLAQHFAARNQPNFAKKKGNIGPGGSMVGPSWANGMLEHSTTFGAGRQTGVGPSGGMEVGMLLGVHEEYVDDGLGFEANLDINRVDVGWEYGGWEGGAKDDRQELGSLLDECLMVGM